MNITSRWIEVSYINPWNGKETKAVLTGAKVEGWKEEFYYSIHPGTKEDGNKIGIWPLLVASDPVCRELDTKEALLWLRAIYDDCDDREAIIADFEIRYSQRYTDGFFDDD